jgi:hypothetical protein
MEEQQQEQAINPRIRNLMRFNTIAVDPEKVVLAYGDRVVLSNNQEYVVGKEAVDAIKWALPAFSAPKPEEAGENAGKGTVKKAGKRTYIRTTEEEKEKWIDMFNRGYRPVDIAEKLGIPYSTISKFLKKYRETQQNREEFQKNWNEAKTDADATPGGAGEDAQCG